MGRIASADPVAQPAINPVSSVNQPASRAIIAACMVIAMSIVLAAATPASGATGSQGADTAAEGDPKDVLSSASSGRDEVELRRNPDERSERQFVYRRGGGALRVLEISVPRHVSALGRPDLALGDDARGRLTLVTESRRGLYYARITGAQRLRRVKRTGRRDNSPSLFRGRIAYGTEGPTPRRGRAAFIPSRLRLAALATGRRRTIWENDFRELTSTSIPSEYFVTQTDVGRGGSVAFVTSRDGAGNGADEGHIALRGREAKRVLSLRIPTSGGGIFASVSSSGRSVTFESCRGSKCADHTYSMRTGRKLS